MLEEVKEEIEDKMQSSLETLRKELMGIRTGRASLALVDGILVDYYGNPTPLKQLATLSVPESRLIVIQPWDNSLIQKMEKAILKSDLGLSPTNDGRLIRISIPPLTEERRKQLVKVVKKMGEENKIAIRNVRRDGNEQLKEFEKEKEITEDELHKGQEEVQKITNKFIAKIDELVSQKEKEILEN